ncbi:transposase [Bradyrhizobium sp.]|uniref:transposase n=1 Tax=Bradyrhizobium sp. TaxID=376 RepID=UPI003C735279
MDIAKVKRMTPMQTYHTGHDCFSVTHNRSNGPRRARLLYLPPYSPDLNPIEMTFAKLKAALRKVAARSIEALVDAIARALAAFTAQECLNFFAAAGYGRV